jgi:hypothetical protein
MRGHIAKVGQCGCGIATKRENVWQTTLTPVQLLSSFPTHGLCCRLNESCCKVITELCSY